MEALNCYDEDRMQNRKSPGPEITASLDLPVAAHATSWLQNNYERSVMPLQLKDILLSEAMSTSKSFYVTRNNQEADCQARVVVLALL